jgi:uncharacterized protein YyaL (SSP411 family)
MASNRLAQESSPYLRQHADNPVDWHPWGEDAFAEARAQDKPIFLSVGYSSCHWCHVMAHESFEDAETAAVMNELFVNVKVDREERPDVDAVYMEAVQALTGHGGWPMSVWLVPDGRPFYAGTYFPRTPRQGMPDFVTVCRAVAEAWRERRAEVEEQAGRLHAALGGSIMSRARSAGAGTDLDVALLDAATTAILGQHDPRFGGFGRAPKFPQAMTLSFLAAQQVRSPSPSVLQALTTSLDAMAAGGIYDHLGGGFARYSVDAHWLVPHFEKMLYDQALLVRAYLRGHLVTGEARWRRVVEETIEYVRRDLGRPGGGFASAEDADSEGEEGRFYVWSLDEIEQVCGDDAPDVIAFFGVTAGGNFEGANILHQVDPAADRPEAVERARARLLAARQHRVRPGLDDKVLLEWNALFVRSLAEAAFALGRSEWLDAARQAARFLLTHLRRDDGRLLRSWQEHAEPRAGWGADGRARHLAYAADHAALLEALLTLAEVDDLAWLADARDVAGALVDLFWDEEAGTFYTTGRDAEALIVRPEDVQDNATPSAVSLAASGLLRLADLGGDPAVAEPARRVVRTLGPVAAQHPTAFAHLLEALERAVLAPLEVVVVGPPGAPATAALRDTVARRLLPASVFCSADAGAPEVVPLLEGRTGVEQPTAYVCEGYACRRPVTTPGELAAQLDEALACR